MFTEKINLVTKITSEKWEEQRVYVLYKRLKKLKRKYTLSTFYDNKVTENKRLLEKETASLLGAYKDYFIHMYKDEQSGEYMPSLGLILSFLEKKSITTENIIEAVKKLSTVCSLSSVDIDTIVWQMKYVTLVKTLTGEFIDGGERLGLITRLDTEAITKELNPLEILYSEDIYYPKLTVETKAKLRRMTAVISRSTGIDEKRLSTEYMNSKDNISAVIYRDYRRVFPFLKPSVYVTWIAAVSIIISLIFSSFMGFYSFLLVFLPMIAIVKPIADLVFSKLIKSTDAPPAIELHGEVPDDKRTLCVISTLITSEKDALEGFQKLQNVRHRNPSKNIKYCLLSDLAPADGSTKPDDEKNITALKNVFLGKEDFVVIVRERKHSKTQGKWQGEERKRGAIGLLMKILQTGQTVGVRACFGDKNALKNIKYVAALDYDTVPMMDSISELVGIAMHPNNHKYGIIAPRMTTTISSYLKTCFSRTMSANGGSAGVSSYDSLAGEFYQDVMGEGIFTGKGLINVDIFYEKCVKEDIFPPEKILSHDILEGGHVGVLYAGNTEFSDNFPPASLPYFKRQDRWLRGDLQNFPEIFNKKFSPLTKLKLVDNIRRVITPISIFILLLMCIFRGENIFGIIALFSLSAPYILSFIPSIIKARIFGSARRFYAAVSNQTVQLIRQCFMEILLHIKNALVSLGALIKTVWRMLFSKRNLLSWTTSTALEKKNGTAHMILSEIVALLMLAASTIFLNPLMITLSLIFSAAMPVLIYADKVAGEVKKDVTEEMEKELLKSAKENYSFYNDYVTAEHNFLPPDNVQYAPIYRVGARTSPTNIGMYLLSLLCFYHLEIIKKDELLSKTESTINTVIKLQKWHGNLMNWYDTRTLEVISPFVSSVDSGNFVCCLVALKEGLIEINGEEKLIENINNVINSTDLTHFYNKSRRLFSIGYDVNEKELSSYYYDLVMSESRMMSYFAIATGQADKRHWRSLERVMGKDGRYAAPIAWTGTMFEYFMPELLLESKEGSMEYEALKYALYSQKKRAHEVGLPFGNSESGYYAFDRDLNYQYKAHGVQAAGLKARLDEEKVVSPYSSFLTMAFDPISSYNNLVKLEKYNMRHPKYGFYEAIDFTENRTGSGYAVIKSHMAHHVGMSVVGITNTLLDGKIQKLFMKDEKMKRAEELLEEKIIAGEAVLSPPEYVEDFHAENDWREIKHFSPENVETNLLSNGKLTVITTGTGVGESIYKDKNVGFLDVFKRTEDILNPSGAIYAYTEGDRIMPFYNSPVLEEESLLAEQMVSFGKNSTEYYRNENELHMGMQIFLHPEKSAEIRKFSIENNSQFKRQLTLAIYLEPILLKYRDYKAHPAFMDMFLDVKYNEDHDFIIVSRKERHGDNVVYMLIGFTEHVDFTFSFDKESVVSRNGGIYSALKNAGKRENCSVNVPSPCVFIKADTLLDANESKMTELFYLYGESEEMLIERAKEIRLEKEHIPDRAVISPLVAGTIYGNLALEVLPYILFHPKTDTDAVMKNVHDKKALWRYSISGDKKIITYDLKGYDVDILVNLAEMKKVLGLTGVDIDLVIIYEEEEQRAILNAVKTQIDTEFFFLNRTTTPENIISLINAVSVYKVDENLFEKAAEKKRETESVKIKPAEYPFSIEKNDDRAERVNHFSAEGDKYIIETASSLPWCNILANEVFGTLLSDKGLGFSWALNSRENKLTPWNNNIRDDNRGERIIANIKGELYDCIDGGRVIFAPNRASYHSKIKDIDIKTDVIIFEKGMGKEVTVTLENKGNHTRKFMLSYYTEPVLGVDRSTSVLLKPQIMDNSIVFTNPSNGLLSGSMCLSCISGGKSQTFMTNRRDFFEGDWFNNEIMPSHEPVGAVIIKIELPPKHKEKIKFILSFTKNTVNPLSMQKALMKMKYVPQITAEDTNFKDKMQSAMYKYWLPWQAIGGRLWAKTGFYQNSGAYGFRDQLQDSIVATLLNEEYHKYAKRQIIRAAASQFYEGDVLHWWHEILNTRKGTRTRYSDDLLWLPYVLSEYVKNTGDYDILNINVHYAEGETLKQHEHEKYIEVTRSEIKEKLYLHAKRAMNKAYKKGEHGLLLMGCGDWCDGYNNVGLKGKGESVWLTMFYILTAKKFIPLAEKMGDNEFSLELKEQIEEISRSIDENAWDGEYYLRAFYDDGHKMGSRDNDMCRLDVLPQAFSAIADLPNKDRVKKALQSSLELCDKNYNLIRLFTPPFVRGRTKQDPGYVMSYPEGMRENGGQYTHAAIWLALAFLKAGYKEEAEKLTKLLAPYNRREDYKTEPYYMSADIYTHPKAYGRGGWSIYTGSAGWYFQLLDNLKKADE